MQRSSNVREQKSRRLGELDVAVETSYRPLQVVLALPRRDKPQVGRTEHPTASVARGDSRDGSHDVYDYSCWAK